MAPFIVPEIQDEEELGKNRLLNIEEKQFNKRVLKRGASLSALAMSLITQGATPPPETDADDDGKPTTAAPSGEEARILREEIITDLAAIDSTVTRLQFAKNAQKRERDRYEKDLLVIVHKSQLARDANTAKRRRLDEAKATKERRKKFDIAADKITSNRTLKPRDEQQETLRELDEENAAIQQDIEDIIATNKQRYADFLALKALLEKLGRTIKEEKEGAEGVAEEAGAGEDENETQTPRPGLASGNATPHPDSGVATRSLPNFEGGATPKPSSVYGGRTPARDTPGPDGDSLKPVPDNLGILSAAGSRSQSRAPSPSQDDRPDRGQAEDTQEHEGEVDKSGSSDQVDVEMADVARPGKPGDVPDNVNQSVSPGPDGTPQLVIGGHGITLKDSGEAA